MVLLEEGSWERDVTSEMVGRESLAARRGKRPLAAEEWADTTCVYGEPLSRSFSRRGDTVSGIGCAYCSEDEWRTERRPFSLAASSAKQARGCLEKMHLLLDLVENTAHLIRAANDEACDLPAQLLSGGQRDERSRCYLAFMVLEKDERVWRCGSRIRPAEGSLSEE